MQFSWTGSDAQSGMRDFQVQEVFGEAQELALTSAGPGSYGVFGQDTTSPCGGGDVGSRFRVVARDKAGNSASSAMTAFNTALVWQEDGTGVWHQPLGVAKTGVWKSSPCSCSDAQRTWYSTSSGSSIKYYLPSVSASADVAIVMGKNSNRAPVALSIDDGPVQIVDTYSPTPANRVVVWRASMSPGAHTLTVTNYATSASMRNRIDVDAVMVAPGWSPQP
ncbi:hypothetical protein GCM10023258_33580 [Terrabacter aeriphilus]|uniref:Uncharacterized protein n=1 Tax=Terrabacter aeriphilus TaxID=515662 RepID=A0ABP9JIT2_9MICO